MIVQDLIKLLSQYPQDIEVLIKELDYNLRDEYYGDVYGEVFVFEKSSFPDIKYIYNSQEPMSKNEVIQYITRELFKEKFNIDYGDPVDYCNRHIQYAKENITKIKQNDDLTEDGKARQVLYQNNIINHYTERLNYLSSIEFKTKVEEEFSKTRQVLVLEREKI